MTIHTHTETAPPVLTYSKSKGLVTLVTGTELHSQTVCFSTLPRSSRLIFLSFFCVLQLL